MGTQPVALITGASSGIGQATAELFAANGFRVFGTSRAPDAGTAQAYAIRPYTMLPLDVRLDESVDAAVRHILDQAGRIDVLVNSAGYSQSGAIEENSIAEAQAQFDTNLFGVMRVIKAAAPIMRRQGGGHIINISSVLGQVAFPYVGLYAASKFALEGFTEALRHELRQFNIQVALIEPGFVKTNFDGQRPVSLIDDYATGRQAAFQWSRAGIEHGMAPGVVAQAILAVATTPTPRLRNRIGRTARLLSALKRLLPEPTFERVQRRIFETNQARTRQPQPRAS
jgi:NAD(P)-dependent dehydrogenase (short-subunit alcohol dehydrogenase family)